MAETTEATGVQATPAAETTVPEPTTTPETPETVQETEEEFDPARARALIQKLRAEAKQASKALKELDTLRAERQAAEDAKLSEQDRLTKRTQQLEAELAFERQERQDRTNRYEVQMHAAKLGIVDPEAAVKLLDWSALEYAEDGTPRDIDKALKLLVRERPYLAGQQAAPQTAATNAATRAGTPGQRIYTQAELNDYSFYAAHRADIIAAMREGRIVQ